MVIMLLKEGIIPEINKGELARIKIKEEGEECSLVELLDYGCTTYLIRNEDIINYENMRS